MTRNVLICVSVGLLFLCALGCQQQMDAAKEKEALTKLFEDNVHGLLNRDIDVLLSTVAEDRIVVDSGQILKPTHAETRKDLRTQFRNGDFTSVTILTAPIIHISADGKMAWCVSQARIKYVGNVLDGQSMEVEFVDAALSVFERRNSKWVEVASAETLGSAPGQ